MYKNNLIFVVAFLFLASCDTGEKVYKNITNYQSIQDILDDEPTDTPEESPQPSDPAKEEEKEEPIPNPPPPHPVPPYPLSPFGIFFLDFRYPILDEIDLQIK